MGLGVKHGSVCCIQCLEWQSSGFEFVTMTTVAARWLLFNTPNELICCDQHLWDKFIRRTLASFCCLSPMTDPHSSLPAWHVAVNLVENQNKGEQSGLSLLCPYLILMFVFSLISFIKQVVWLWAVIWFKVTFDERSANMLLSNLHKHFEVY